jgi:outer membrane lipoprotein-sorting protein
MKFSVRAWDRSGDAANSRAELLWLRNPDGLSSVLLRLSEPADTRGTSVLVIQHLERDPDLYVYLPELSKVKRVRKRRLRGPLFGTDFSYEDFERVQGLAQKTRVERLADRQLAERRVWTLEVHPNPKDSDYERIITLVDQEYCLPLRMEFYGAGDKLRKVLTSDPARVRKEGDHYVPYAFEMNDVRDETRTVVTIDHVGIDPQLDAEIFTASALLSTH